mgnify:CR=1 FL=1
MIEEKGIRKICEAVLQRCKGAQAEVLVGASDSALTRFANNIIHQNVAERDVQVTLRFMLGKHIGTVTTNRSDEVALDALVANARAYAKASPEDPDYPGLPEPATYGRVDAFDLPTQEYSPEARARAIAPLCRLAAEKKLNASGAFTTGASEFAVANTRGVFAYHAVTNADFQTVVMGADASGRAQGSDWKAGAIPVEKLGQDAILTAERGKAPRKIEPGEYTVVFEHYVTEDLLLSLNFYGMGAQALLEGRSWMNDRLGQKVMSEKVSIWDDGLDPAGSPLPFDFEGVPKQRVDIVKDGVALGPVYDRYTGAKAGKPGTGHALPPEMRGFGPVAANLFMGTGESSVEEMIRSTERGIYVNRFWYTRLVHPRDCVVTGMTRDGVFMIENGELSYPVKNLRFTMPYLTVLANVEAVGEQSHLLLGEYGGLASRVPALKVQGFNFSGSTV